MTSGRFVPLRASRWLDLATYPAVVIPCSLGFQGLTDPAARAAVVVLCLAFLLIHRFVFQTARDERQLMIYSGAQVVVITGLLLLRSRNSDTFTFLFFLLSIRVGAIFPPRRMLAWVALFFTISSLVLLWMRGLEAVLVILFNAAVFGLCSVFGQALREVEIARQENASMLEELRRAQRQIQDLAIAEERNRLARDLHDSAKQQAFALSAQLDAARSLLGRDPAAADRHLRQAEQLADLLRQELATLILELRPPALGDHGLADALRRYVTEWSQQSGIAAEFQVYGERPLPREVEHTLFRLSQEALANVARHSQARRVEVQLDCREAQVKLSVKDDGHGFDPALVPPGLGTQSMRERAAALPNGTLTLDSAPGQGTWVTVTGQC
ncbi:MAG: sensor histidine kinase [Anaerolineales bacterium]|nr:sensor histidine kinase [Anaerolineales bacterium]